MNEQLQNKLIIQNKILDNLNEIKNSIKEIKTYFNELRNNILDYIKKTEESIEIIQNEMNNFIKSLERAKEYNEEIDLKSLFNTIKTPFEKFYSLNYQIYENNYIKNIEILNEKIKDKKENIKDDIEFDPPFQNNFESNDTKFNSYYDNSMSNYDNDNIQKCINSNECLYNNKSYFNYNIDNNNESDNEEINNRKIKCSACNKNEAITFCEHCSQLFCDSCFDLLDEKIQKMHQPRANII